eukprot:11189459-Lingulodinium_polyedra.AAC.1
MQSRQRACLLQVVLAAWLRQHGRQGAAIGLQFQEARIGRVHLLDRHIAVAQAAQSKLAKEAEKAVKVDKRDHYLELAEEARQAAAVGDGRVLYEVATRLRPPKVRQLPQVRHEDGSIIKDAVAARQRWVRHFQQVMLGEPSSIGELQVEAMPPDVQAFKAIAAGGFTCKSSPTPVQLALTFARLRTRKAFGEDSIPSEVLKGAAAQAAWALHPVMVRAAWRLQEPVPWRGNFVQELFKGK